MTEYRVDHLHHGFDKHVLDIALKSGKLCRTATHYFFDLEGPESKPHDHPFDITSDVREGSYIEEIYHPLEDGYWWKETHHRKQGERLFIKADTIHKLIALPDGECVTQVIQGEPYRQIRMWHFDPAKELQAPSN